MLVTLSVDRRTTSEHLSSRLVEDSIVAMGLRDSLKVPFGGSSVGKGEKVSSESLSENSEPDKKVIPSPIRHLRGQYFSPCALV